jgi:hypothetical protein
METPIGQVLQFGYDADDMPALLRRVAEGIEQLGPDVRILDVTVRPDKLTAEIYFLRTD